MQLKKFILTSLLVFPIIGQAELLKEGKSTLFAQGPNSMESLIVEKKASHGTISVFGRESVGHGSFVEAADNLEIKFTVKPETERFPSLYNPYTKQVEHVRTITKFSKYTLKSFDGIFFKIIKEGERCHTFYQPDSMTDKVECKQETEIDPFDYLYIQTPRSVRTIIKEGDRVALPTSISGYGYVQLMRDGSVNEIIADPKGPKITGIENINNMLEVKTQDGGKILYSRLGDFYGSEFLIGDVQNNLGETISTVQGMLVVDEKVKTQALDLTGSYVVAAFGQGYGNFEEFTLNYNANGLGGFESYDIINDKMNTGAYWSWEQTSEGILAKRWMTYDDRDHRKMMIEDDEIASCVDGSGDCFVYQNRRYVLLGKSGNRYIMLRELTIDFGRRSSNRKPSVDTSINIFYKK